MRLIPLLLLSLALIAAGCAKKDDGETPPPGGNTTTTSTTMTTTTPTTTTPPGNTTTTPPTARACTLNETVTQNMAPPGGVQAPIVKTVTVPAGCSTLNVTVTFTPSPATLPASPNNVAVTVADSAGTACKTYTAPNPLTAATTVGPDACAFAVGDATVSFSGAGPVDVSVTLSA